MKNGDKPTANPFVMLREDFDDWAVLFDPDTGHGFGLNPTGVCVWKLLDGEHALGALLGDIGHHADHVPEDASDHIEAFVDELVAQGLAGFDSAGFGLLKSADGATLRPGKGFPSLLGPGSEIEPFNYEPPRLVNLSGERAACWDCNTTGSQATTSCNANGNLAGSWCDCGTSGYKCCIGGACVCRGWRH